MWEARAVPGARRTPARLGARGHAGPSRRRLPRRRRIASWSSTRPGWALPDAPPELLARPPHVWPFERVSALRLHPTAKRSTVQRVANSTEPEDPATGPRPASRPPRRRGRPRRRGADSRSASRTPRATWPRWSGSVAWRPTRTSRRTRSSPSSANYRLRHYFADDAPSRCDAGRPRPAADDDHRGVGRLAGHLGGRRAARVRGIDAVGRRLRPPRPRAGRPGADADRPRPRGQRRGRAGERGDRPQRRPGRLLAGRHVLSTRPRPTGGARASTRSSPSARRSTPPRRCRSRSRPTSWPGWPASSSRADCSARSRCRAGWSGYGFKALARPSRCRAGSSSCSRCTTATRCCRASGSAASSTRPAGRPTPGRPSPSCSSSSSPTTGCSRAASSSTTGW